MLKTNDLILLLTELEEKGVKGATQQIRSVISQKELPLDAIKFIHNNRPIDVAEFYKKLRRSYNANKSSLYINLVRENVKEPTEVLITLASLNLQILLFAKKLEQPQMFLAHSRAEEITRVINNYYRTYDLQPILALRTLIKADLKSFEEISR